MPKQIGRVLLYDLQELSEKLEIDVRSLRKWIRDGKIKAKKIGVKYFITEQNLYEYLGQADNMKNASAEE